MLKKIIFHLLLILAVQATAQVADQFSDGNFSANPQWAGDDSLFQVNTSFQLQSMGTVAKDIALATASTVNNGEWLVWLRFNLSPSTSNFCRYYLMSDSANLKGPLNGYFIQAGGITGANDSIMLFKQKGLIQTLVIGGRRATVSKSSNVVRIKVLRDLAGNWSLFSDTTGASAFVAEGTGTDNELNSSSYMGLMARFTASNAAGFFMDDVYAGPVIVDNTPPAVDSVQVINNNTLRVKFSESVESVSATDINNYALSGGLGSPLSAIFEGASDHVVILSFFSAFTNKTNYTLSVSGISDLNNNTLTLQQTSFYYYVPVTHDVLISEWMADPSPQVGLPDQEFIELYNNTTTAIKLGGWTISDGGTPAVLPDITILPDSFLILCSTTNAPLFSAFGATAGVAGLPSLNNSGDPLILKSPAGDVIHQLQYDLSWYNDPSKEDGGWTIELLNPLTICRGKKNFSASVHVNGGTPGKVNAVWSKTPDTTPPAVTSLSVSGNTQLRLAFNETIDAASVSGSVITINNGISVQAKTLTGTDGDTLLLTLNPPLTSGVNYTYNLSGIKDCSINTLNNATGNFSWFQPDKAAAYDILITEIMADPDPVVGMPNAEYLELYNRSNKNISLNGWTLHDASGSTALPDVVLLPDSFIVFCSTANMGLFTGVNNISGLSGFPSFSNEGERMVIKDADNHIIHTVNYSSNWYADNLKKAGGWSLEMVDVKNPCTGEKNWMASKHVKGGTPGKPNSVRAYNPDTKAPELLRAYPVNSSLLRLYFDESLDSAALSTSFFMVNNQLGSPIGFSAVAPEFNIVDLTFASPAAANTIYRIITDSVKDCSGNLIREADYADFGLPETFDSLQLIVNEILFNPKTGGSDFVELYNNSGKIIDLKDVSIANVDELNQIDNFYPVAPDGFIVLPDQHVVLSENTSGVFQQYFGANPVLMINCSLPSFNDDAGNCVLINQAGKRYDQLYYDDKMHFALLDDKDGVSLERIDYNRPTNDRTNWTSAAASVGYATPTRKNSQYLKSAAERSDLKALPEVFSPDGDGFNDVVNIYINMAEPGHTGNLFIYDNRGVLVKQLLRNEILGTTDIVTWDGVTDKNEKAPIGIYILYLETFNLKGDTSKTKTTVVVGAKL